MKLHHASRSDYVRSCSSYGSTSMFVDSEWKRKVVDWLGLACVDYLIAGGDSPMANGAGRKGASAALADGAYRCRQWALRQP